MSDKTKEELERRIKELEEGLDAIRKWYRNEAPFYPRPEKIADDLLTTSSQEKQGL